MAAAAAVNGDHHHQPPIASIHRNGRVSEAALAANTKAVAIPKVKSKSKSKSIDKTLTNGGDLTGNLIEFSIADSIDGNHSGGDHSALLSLASPVSDKITRNSQQQTSTSADLSNVIQANKTIVALSILIQHLTTDVSVAHIYTRKFISVILYSEIRMNYSIIYNAAHPLFSLRFYFLF